ncbi:MAG: anthranilate/aminodeoxychorismate synthase component II [Acidobacteriota bacterium]
MRVLVLDNGDPCPGNLLEPLQELGADCDVRPAGSLGLKEIRALEPQPRRILFTPGSGRPEDTGACWEVVSFLPAGIPVLGVGLGLQIIAKAGQARLVRPGKAKAGGMARIHHDGKNLFAGLPSPFEAPRDPDLSFIVDPAGLGTQLDISARDEHGTVVGCRALFLGLEAIQVDTRWFSTRHGSDMLFNFLYQSQAW